MNKRLSKRNRLILLLKLMVIILLFAVLVAATLFLNYRLLVVKNLDTNLINISCADSKSLSDLSELLGQSMLMINKLKVEQNLKEVYLCIKRISFIKHLPDKVTMDVFGREGAVSLVRLDPKVATPSASFENVATPSAEDFLEGKTYTADAEGVIFSKKEDGGLPVIYLYGFLDQDFDKKEIDLIREVVRVIDKLRTFGLDTKDGYLNQMATFMVNIYPKIIFNLSENVDVQLASLQLILEQAKIGEEMLEFIDLRFDKPVIRIAPKDK